MDIKKGDVVHVRGTVQSVYKDAATVEFNHHLVRGPGYYLLMGFTDIVHVEPRPLAVGDEVEFIKVPWHENTKGGTLLCIDGGVGWVKMRPPLQVGGTSFEYCSPLISNLRRV